MEENTACVEPAELEAASARTPIGAPPFKVIMS